MARQTGRKANKGEEAIMGRPKKTDTTKLPTLSKKERDRIQANRQTVDPELLEMAERQEKQSKRRAIRGPVVCSISLSVKQREKQYARAKRIVALQEEIASRTIELDTLLTEPMEADALKTPRKPRAKRTNGMQQAPLFDGGEPGAESDA
jgi:hypothetical protein